MHELRRIGIKMTHKYKRVITFGTFDLLHEGHLRILQRAKELGEYLIVGVSNDALNSRKGKQSVFPEAQRLSYIKDLKYVDEVFLEESLEQKNDYIKQFNADVLVMGDDWKGGFDWVSCDVVYLPRTEDISSTILKDSIRETNKCQKVLFGDTYIRKHMSCVLPLVNILTDKNVAPIFTNANKLPRGINCDCLAYLNKPINQPQEEYNDKKRVLIDHGASHLKWFLGNKERLDFFDVILTAGPDHVRVLESIFPNEKLSEKVRSTGFIKSDDLLSPPKLSREELCEKTNLDPEKPIVVFVPTWYITSNDDIIEAIASIREIPNHVASLHPETAHVPTGDLNVVENINDITTELLKHADCVISDLSSTIYEAAALGKPVVQILLKEYPDNVATMYDLPYTAGTAELFCGGITCRPSDVAQTVADYLAGKYKNFDPNEYMRKRILSGTFITKNATQNIADELQKICSETREPAKKLPSGAVIRAPQIQNKFYAQNRIIAHAGGNFNKIHASNSREAIEAALGATNIIELDFTMDKNNDVLVCHDGFEEKYGLKRPFNEITEVEFLNTKFEKELTPIVFQDAIKLAAQPGKALICDIKPTKQAYAVIARSIYDQISDADMLERTVIQCYSVDDFKQALSIGFTRCLLPAWKYFYRNPIGEDVFNFIETCININANAVTGISLPYYNHHLEKPIIEYEQFPRFFSFWKRVFIHGAPPEKYPEMLKMNLGIFADHFTRSIEFKDLPAGFNWKEYLFLNRDLPRHGIDNQIGAVQHYLKYGQKEKRLYSYDVPHGFNYGDYIHKNPHLRRLGLNGIDSAKAYITKQALIEK